MRYLLALLVVLGLPLAAQAYTCNGSLCTSVLSYTEPSTYVGGAPLADLKEGVFTFKLNGGMDQVLTIPASRPQGGGGVISTNLPAQSIPACTVGVVTGSLVMKTSAGGVSAAVNAPPLTIDRTRLAGGSPDPACTTPSPATPTLS